MKKQNRIILFTFLNLTKNSYMLHEGLSLKSAWINLKFCHKKSQIQPKIALNNLNLLHIILKEHVDDN